MKWNSALDESVEGSYEAEVVTIKIMVSNADPAVSVIVSSREAEDVRCALKEEVLAFEASSQKQLVVNEYGDQSDMGDAVCVLHYVLDAAATGLVGAAAWELLKKLTHKLDTGVVQWSSRTSGGRPIRVSPLSEEHVRWSAKLLLAERFHFDQPPHIDQVVQRGASATVWMSATSGTKLVLEIEFDGPIATLKSIEVVRRYV